MKRGDIYWVNLEPSSPPEFGKIRPALIVSNTEQNLELDSVVVIPISTKAPEIWPLRIALPRIANMKPAFAVTPGIRQVSKTRLSNKAASVPSTFYRELDAALFAYLG